MNLKGLAAALAALVLAGCAHHGRPAVKPTPTPQKTSASQPVSAHSGCARPTPTTAAGFAALFASLPPAQWGAADVALSVPLGDGRILWLFGDTFSTGRFVHSSAIVQDRGCLHVVNRGAQILPNVDAHHIYWVRAATPASDDPRAVIITARAITLTGKGPWDFRDGGYDQLMVLVIDQRGEATDTVPPEYAKQWALVSPLGPGLHTAGPDPGPMYLYGPHHFGYARHAHPEFKLADGGVLVTTCQNWDDGVLHPMASYRPIFTSSR